jgi:filamentous hemagglutinin
LGVGNPNGNEFAGLGIRTRTQFKEHVEGVINKPTHSGNLNNNRSYFYDSTSNTIVIKNPKAPDGGTVFRIDTKKYPNPLDYINDVLN